MEPPRFKVHEYVWAREPDCGGVVLSMFPVAWGGMSWIQHWFYMVRLTNGEQHEYREDFLMPWCGTDRSRMWEKEE